MKMVTHNNLQFQMVKTVSKMKYRNKKSLNLFITITIIYSFPYYSVSKKKSFFFSDTFTRITYSNVFASHCWCNTIWFWPQFIVWHLFSLLFDSHFNNFHPYCLLSNILNQKLNEWREILFPCHLKTIKKKCILSQKMSIFVIKMQWELIKSVTFITAFNIWMKWDERRTKERKKAKKTQK